MQSEEPCEKQFVELDKSGHDRTSFDCGEQQLNDFIKQQALRHMKASVSRTMVLTGKEDSNGKNAICAFYTIVPSSISRKQLPETLARKLPHYPIPVFLLAQLAVDEQHQGSGLGKITLIKALQHLHSVNEYMRAYAVIVDCLNENAESFYQQYGFASLGEQNGMARMYIPMKQLDALFG